MKKKHLPGMLVCRRDERGRLLPIPALKRFAEKCTFDPLSGCVLWIGGTTAGRGNSARYGSFWFEGTRWFAHRWSAIHIHGLNLGTNQAGHNCPYGPNTLCVEHVIAQTQLENLDEQNGRMKARVVQSASERQFYLFVALGIEPAPVNSINWEEPTVPFHLPPEWLRPFLPEQEIFDDCPF